MDAIIGVFQFIQGLGVSVVMPIVIFIIGCAFRTGVGKSLRAGLTVGVGFIGLNLVINSLLGTSLSPAVQAMIDRFGLSLSTIDVDGQRQRRSPWVQQLIDYYPARLSGQYRDAPYQYDTNG